MLYIMFGSLGVSVIAALWMAKLLGSAGAYKQALLVLLIATLGWCAPWIFQVFLAAGLVTIGVQYWEEVKPALVLWVIAAATAFAVGQMSGEQIGDQLDQASEKMPVEDGAQGVVEPTSR